MTPASRARSEAARLLGEAEAHERAAVEHEASGRGTIASVRRAAAEACRSSVARLEAYAAAVDRGEAPDKPAVLMNARLRALASR